MWFLNFIPSGVLQLAIHALVVLGIVAYVVGVFGRSIRAVEEYAVAIKVLGSVLFCLGIFFEGGYATDLSWQLKIVDMQKEHDRLEQAVKDSEAKSADNNVKIKTVYVDRVKVVKQVQIQVREKIKEIATKIDAECKVDPEAISILNTAARNPAASVTVTVEGQK